MNRGSYISELELAFFEAFWTAVNMALMTTLLESNLGSDAL